AADIKGGGQRRGSPAMRFRNLHSASFPTSEATQFWNWRRHILKRISPKALPWKLPREKPDPGISPIRATRAEKRDSVRGAKRSSATLRSFVKGAAFRSCRNSAKFSASKHCSWDSRYPTAAHTHLTKIFLSKILKVESV